LQKQFAELDSLWRSSPTDLDAQLDDAGETIVVTRRTYDYGIDVSDSPERDLETADPPSADQWNQHDCEAYGAGTTLPISDSYEAVRTSGQMRSPFQSAEPVMKIDLSRIEISDEVIYKRLTLSIDPSEVGFLPDVKLMGIGATGIYEVLEDYSYPIDYFSIGREMPFEVREEYYSLPGRSEKPAPHLCTITVKKGFQFDRATIPRLFWVIVSKDDLSNVAPLFHDLLYRFQGVLHPDWVEPYTTFTREEADFLFFHMMAKSGVKSWRLHIAYQAVCRFSSFAWGRHH